MKPRKRFDRLWWPLAILALVGFGVIFWRTRREAKAAVEWVNNPLANPQPSSQSTARAVPGRADSADVDSIAPAQTPEAAPRKKAPRAVELLTTPAKVAVATMTQACQSAIKARGPWKDSVTTTPWPECIDAQQRPMVVQFCSYVRLSTGEWVASENTRNAPRCRAELPLVRRGKVQGVASQ